MRVRSCYAIARAALVSVAFLTAVPIPTVIGLPSAHAASPLQVVVRRVTTLDAHGHIAHVFGPGSAIQLRIEWKVRGAPPHAPQTTTWAVFYAGHQTMLVTKTAPARAGNWSRVTMVTVTRAPHGGVHVFWGRVSIDGVSSARSVAFTVRR